MLLNLFLPLILAYFLHDRVTKVENLVGSRRLATLLIILSLVLLLALGLIIVSPILYRQAISLMKNLHPILSNLEKFIEEYFPEGKILLKQPSLQPFIHSFNDFVAETPRKLPAYLWDSTIFAANTVTTLVLTPIVAFYLLKDWQLFSEYIKSLIPPRHKMGFYKNAELINANIRGYVFAQFKIGMILAFLYSTLLSLTGLPYAFFIGTITGLLTIVPYLGTIFGLLVGHAVALYHFQDVLQIIPITLVFTFCCALENFILAPKFLSKGANLHPIWIIFSIMIGSSLFGLLGILLAVPVTSMIAVIVKVVVEHYKNSHYYSKNAAL